MSLPLKEENIYIDSNSSFARLEFNKVLFDFLVKHYGNDYSDLVIMCIGTDRSTGDSLGPLIGHKLSNSFKTYPNVYVLGTLDHPIHAKNLEKNIEYIYSNFNNPFIIAIDACLGSRERVGYINIAKGSLKPGSGVNKVLPSVGDISIVGIVNISGFMEYMVLQSTRLSIVMKIADVIASSFKTALWRFFKSSNDQKLEEMFQRYN